MTVTKEVNLPLTQLDELLAPYIPPRDTWNPADEAGFKPGDPYRVPLEEARDMQLKAIKFTFRCGREGEPSDRLVAGGPVLSGLGRASSAGNPDNCDNNDAKHPVWFHGGSKVYACSNSLSPPRSQRGTCTIWVLSQAGFKGFAYAIYGSILFHAEKG